MNSKSDLLAKALTILCDITHVSKDTIVYYKKLMISISRSTLNYSGGIRRAEFKSPVFLFVIGLTEKSVHFLYNEPAPAPSKLCHLPERQFP